MEILSKQDLEIFRIRIISDIERLLETTINQPKEEFEIQILLKEPSLHHLLK